MALIGKISEKRILVVVVVGLALLAFIIGTYFTGGSMSDMERTSQVGTVNGKPLDDELFNNYKSNIEQQKLYEKSQKAKGARVQLTQAERDAAAEQAFGGVAQRALLDQEFEKLGITVSPEEFDVYFYGEDEEIPRHPSIAMNQMFMDSTRQFSQARFESFINGDMAQNEEQAAQIEKYIDGLKKDLTQNLKSNKYVKLMAMGMYTTQAEAKHAHQMNNSSKSVRFVQKRYSDLSKDYKLTDEQLKAYYEEHKGDKNYEQKDGAVLQYVSLIATPVDSDFESSKRFLETKKEAFKNAENDSLFAAKNSVPEDVDKPSLGESLTGRAIEFDITLNNGRFGTYSESVDEQVQKAEVGSLIGPFQMNNNSGKPCMVLCKVKSIEENPTTWVRHILIKTSKEAPNYLEKKAFADSLAGILTLDNSRFEEFVNTYSEDLGSVQNGGQYKWFKEGEMQAGFNDFSFNKAVGDIGVAETSYGFHIVEKLGARPTKTPTVYAISSPVKVSNASIEVAKKSAYEFRKKVKSNPNDFDTIAEQMQLRPLKMNLYTEKGNAGAFGTGANLAMRFALNKDQRSGDVSKPIVGEDQQGNKKVFVVLLKKKLNAGIPEFEDVKDRMKFKATNDAIAKDLKEKMASYKNLNELASAMETEVQSGEVSFGNGNVAGSNEPKVAGAIFTNIGTGQLTKPIEGNSGVFVVELVSAKDAPEVTDYSKELETLQKNNEENAVSGYAMQALLEKYKPVDDRNRIKYGAK